MKAPVCFIDPLDTPLGRRSSYLCFANDNKGEPQLGKSTLYLSTCRGGGSGMADLNAPNHCRAVKLELFRERALPAVISDTVSEVILESEAGAVRCCIADKKLVLIKGTDGLGLKISLPASFMTPPLELVEGCYRFAFGEGSALLTVLKGKLANVGGGLIASPDEAGILLLAFEESDVDILPRAKEDYPDYDEAVRAYEAEFDAFCDTLYPSLPAEFEPMRRQALYTTWSLMVDPDEGVLYPRTMVKMMRFIFESAFGWQQAMQAICLAKNPRLAWDILMSCFELQDKNGRIADAVSHRAGMGNSMKPPFQGVALKWLLENADLSGIPAEEKHTLFVRMGKWVDFFFKFRDVDGKGVWANFGPIETGWEDASYFYAGFPLAAPDANAYTVVMMDALATLGRSIGEDEALCKAWEQRADALTQKLIETCWNGQRWVPVNTRTGAKGLSDSLPPFAALILGKRLPQEIIDKTVAWVFGEHGFETDFGFASENVHSPFFHHGFTGGSVIVPAQLIMCLALEAAGEKEKAKEMGLRYARTLRDNGLFHIHNALNGKGERGLVAFGEKQLFWSSWASSVYLFLADRYGR